MQFLITAHDGTDAEAPARRQAHRPAHIAGLGVLKSAGHLIIAGAILDDASGMIGSAVIVDFPDRAGLDAWLKSEPFVVHKVWHHIDIQPYRVAKVD